MEPLTKQDLLDALQPLTTDVGVLKTDVRIIRRDIKIIHEDLKAHDVRAEETNAKINELLELKKLEGQISQMRENIRVKLGVEV